LRDDSAGVAKERQRMGKQAAGWWEAGMEKRAATRCQAGIKGSRIADAPYPPHPWQMDAVFCPVAQSRFDLAMRAMTCSLSISSGLSHRFLTRVVTVVLFFKERGFHMSQTEHQFSLSLFYKGWIMGESGFEKRKKTDHGRRSEQ
jgi:hypothetical protein